MIFERLDRFLGNNDWISLYPDCVIHHLPRLKSDHNPILFVSAPSHSHPSPRPFRCEKIWVDQPEFSNLVKLFWSFNGDTSSSLDLLKNKALLWNKNSFGNIFHKKNILIKRLEGVHAALGNSPNSFLLNLEADLYHTLSNHLKMIEDFWASKARIDWLNSGVENSAFFYAPVNNRRRTNRINSLKNNLG